MPTNQMGNGLANTGVGTFVGIVMVAIIKHRGHTLDENDIEAVMGISISVCHAAQAVFRYLAAFLPKPPNSGAPSS